jgi:hypothetical protein
MNFCKQNKKSDKEWYDSLIYGFLIVPIWIIGSIEIEVFPKIPVPEFSEGLCDNFNRFFLNLSYGYIAGIIIYSLTVIIPQHKRNRTVRPLIKNMVLEYYSNLQLFYAILYYSDPSANMPPCKKAEVSKFINKLTENNPDVFEAIKERMITTAKGEIKQAVNQFKQEITPYEKYLSKTQLEFFISLNMNVIYLQSVYLNFPNDMAEEALRRYISGVKKLMDTF